MRLRIYGFHKGAVYAGERPMFASAPVAAYISIQERLDGDAFSMLPRDAHVIKEMPYDISILCTVSYNVDCRTGTLP